MSSERDEEFENEPEYLFELLKLSLDRWSIVSTYPGTRTQTSKSLSHKNNTALNQHRNQNSTMRKKAAGKNLLTNVIQKEGLLYETRKALVVA